MRRLPSLAFILWCGALLMASVCAVLAQDSTSDCIVSKNGVCLDGALGKSAAPAAPAKPSPVVLQGNRLTIVSDSSTLKEILTAVGSLTGLEMELPAAGLEERVVAHLGPGTTRDVLIDLLNGSPFNYVMVASPANPTVLQKLVLTDRGAQVASSAIAIPQPPPDAGENTGPALYGQGFKTDPSAASAEPDAPAPVAKDADWAHTQGQLLDQMQKQRIKEREEQQQPPPQAPQGNPESQ